ncbi:hypothetical protein PVE_R2G0550 [Pseudomonas veronii 1YdBTEX2]|uniref:Uncharacterized protein n=1 Tax=Pseudomonas veronii 1YdBTEX2 TaxID=1295141 RepID=A0A1D3K8C0_PSEVE|nr:hypothetical protein PVE_R2G0550 [Pseudomonas veronii 1YdBTEX2]
MKRHFCSRACQPHKTTRHIDHRYRQPYDWALCPFKMLSWGQEDDQRVNTVRACSVLR